MSYHCTTFKATSDVDIVRIYNAARFISSILLVNSSYYSIYHPSPSLLPRIYVWCVVWLSVHQVYKWHWTLAWERQWLMACTPEKSRTDCILVSLTCTVLVWLPHQLNDSVPITQQLYEVSIVNDVTSLTPTWAVAMAPVGEQHVLWESSIHI